MQEILSYYLFVRIISSIVDSRLGFVFSHAIISGEISNLMLKPIKKKFWLMSEEIGRTILDLIVKLILYIVLFKVLLGDIVFQSSNIPFFTISIVLSFLISFNIFFIAECVAFWAENVSTLRNAIRRVIFFLSGGLIPITFFPDKFQAILKFLPFEYVFNTPLAVINGNIEESKIVITLLIQIVWVVVLWKAGNVLYIHSFNRNESVGI